MYIWWVHHLLSIATFLLTLAFLSSILRSRRPAGSTLAWLLVICAIPYVGIPLYLFLSGRKFKRQAKNAKLYHPGAPGDSPPDLSATRKILHTCGIPASQSNRLIQLLPTDVDAYDRLIGLIRGARKSIHITTFIFGDDEVGNAVVGALTEKAAAGVEVRVLVDSLGAAMIKHPHFARFERAGGRIAYFMPIFHVPFRGRTNLRNHRKLMVIDGQTALLGGMNLAQEYLGPVHDPKRWVDLALWLEGACVADIERLFLQDWAFATHGPSPVLAPAPPPAPAAAVPSSPDDRYPAQVVASGPDVQGDPLYDVLLTTIYEAKNRVWIVTPYFIPDESLAKALELAAMRGVDVQIILPRRSNHRLADIARGSFVRQLLTAGARFGFYPRMIHAKAVLVDRELAILGSANFDMRSLLLNYELGLIIYSNSVLPDVEQWISAKFSETSADFTPAGYWRELAEGIGRVIGPIL